MGKECKYVFNGEINSCGSIVFVGSSCIRIKKNIDAEFFCEMKNSRLTCARSKQNRDHETKV